MCWMVERAFLLTLKFVVFLDAGTKIKTVLMSQVDCFTCLVYRVLHCLDPTFLMIFVDFILGK